MVQLQVCLSPALLGEYEFKESTVVVTDVLRATSTMVAALQLGVEKIIPVASRKEAKKYLHQKGFLVAGERDGKKVEGFDLGNSPLGLRQAADQLKVNTFVMTTTNGTKAIEAVKDAEHIIIGALNNVHAVAEHVIQYNQPILVLCAGWKNRVNLEDTLFAGALCDALQGKVAIYGDAAIMSHQLFKQHQHHLFTSIKDATHYQRLKSHGIEQDIEHCMRLNTSEIVPIVKEKYIIKASS